MVGSGGRFCDPLLCISLMSLIPFISICNYVGKDVTRCQARCDSMLINTNTFLIFLTCFVCILVVFDFILDNSMRTVTLDQEQKMGRKWVREPSPDPCSHIFLFFLLEFFL